MRFFSSTSKPNLFLKYFLTYFVDTLLCISIVLCFTVVASADQQITFKVTPVDQNGAKVDQKSTTEDSTAHVSEQGENEIRYTVQGVDNGLPLMPSIVGVGGSDELDEDNTPKSEFVSEGMELLI